MSSDWFSITKYLTLYFQKNGYSSKQVEPSATGFSEYSRNVESGEAWTDTIKQLSDYIEKSSSIPCTGDFGSNYGSNSDALNGVQMMIDQVMLPVCKLN